MKPIPLTRRRWLGCYSSTLAAMALAGCGGGGDGESAAGPSPGPDIDTPPGTPTPLPPSQDPPLPPGADGSLWTEGQGAGYKGNQTFDALRAVYAAIAPAGGWAQLPNSTLSSAFPTAGQIDSISPLPVLRQNQWPNNATVWASAAFNGYGWYYVTPGGHFAGYMNDTYILRIADPVGPLRMHAPAPIFSVARRSDGVLLDRSMWATQSSLNVSCSPEWGPTGCHQYSGMLWHAASEKLVFGGDQQFYHANPGSVGEVGRLEHAIYVFDPYAPSPREAWARIQVASSGDYHMGVGMMLNGDGTVSFRDFGPARQRFTLNVDTHAVMSDAPHPSPRVDANQSWRHVARDPVSGRTFELDRQGNLDADAAALFETTSGRYVKVANLPASWWTGSIYQDNQSKIELVGSRAYVIAQTGPGAASALRLGVHQIDLNSGAVRSFVDSPSIPIPEGLYDGISLNGIHGRFAFVPQVGCFVVFPSARSNVWVFRPPQDWSM